MRIPKKQVSINEAKSVAPRGDPVQVLKLLPGVQSTGFSPNIIVRGSGPNDSKYLIDGLDVPFIFHSVGGISIIPEEMIDNIDFSSGGFGPWQGEATGGLINIQTKTQIEQERKTSFTFNIPLYSGFFHTEPIDKESSISFAYRRSYIDAFIGKIFEGQDMLVLPAFTDAHIQYKRKRKGGYSKVLFLSSLDKLNLALNSQGSTSEGQLNFEILTQFASLGLEYYQKVNKKWSYFFTPHVIYTRVKTEVEESYVNIEGPSIRVPLEYRKRLSRKEKLYIGTRLQLDRIKINLLAPRINPDDPFIDYEEAPVVKTETNYQKYRIVGWVSMDKIIGSLTLTPGVRVFYAEQVQKPGADPRFTSSFTVNKDVELGFSVGQYSQSPEPAETDPDFGNANLTYEKTLQYVLAYKKRWSDKWKTDFQVYHKSSDSIIRSDSIERYKNSGIFESTGLEVFLRRYETQRAFGWVSYTLSRSREKKTSDASWVPTQYDQTHVVNFVGFYRFTGQWSLGCRLNYRTGERYTPISDTVFNVNFGKYQERYKDSERYKENLPAYNQLDVYTVYDFLFRTSKLKLRVGIEYLALSPPAFGVTYNYDYSKKEFFTGLPPIPYIELKGSF